MIEYMNIEYLETSEAETKELTWKVYATGNDKVCTIINLLFEMSYCFGTLENIETIIGNFQSTCSINYIQIPYTFYNVFNLYERGHYLECLILLRHILETLLKMKYLYKHLDKHDDHVYLQNKGKGKITFLTMFNEFGMKDFYDKFYGSHLSDAAHGIIMKDLFRSRRFENKTVMGSEFNQKFASYIINIIIALLSGYINHFPLFFQKNTMDQNANINNNYNSLRNWLSKTIEKHKTSIPDVTIWFDGIDKLINI